MGTQPELLIRPARAADVPLIVGLIREDEIAAAREGEAGDPAYLAAFSEIAADPRQRLVVGERDGQVVATLQLTIIPGLSRRGMARGLIEAVRVRGDQRGAGIGRQLLEWAIAEAQASGCGMVQLTTDARRADAQRFYASLGFQTSHIGMKLML